jgi:hypothetical protein
MHAKQESGTVGAKKIGCMNDVGVDDFDSPPWETVFRAGF